MQDFDFLNIETLNKYQRFLYGHDDSFNNLSSLQRKQKLPNKIIFSGSDGIGKATFIFHLINFILSNNEEGAYNINIKEINLTTFMTEYNCDVILNMTEYLQGFSKSTESFGRNKIFTTWVR